MGVGYKSVITVIKTPQNRKTPKKNQLDVKSWKNNNIWRETDEKRI